MNYAYVNAQIAVHFLKKPACQHTIVEDPLEVAEAFNEFFVKKIEDLKQNININQQNLLKKVL